MVTQRLLVAAVIGFAAGLAAGYAGGYTVGWERGYNSPPLTKLNQRLSQPNPMAPGEIRQPHAQ